MVIWLIGLSGVGKSTIGRILHRQWQVFEANTVLIDGDEIREVFRQDQDPDAYSLGGRRRNADRVNRLCAWLDRQGINVVCCLLSLFEDTRQWNRRNLTQYFEVYLTAPMNVLEARDTKGLYRAAREGSERNVVGYDIPFPPPAAPDLIVDTSDPGNAPHEVTRRILAHVRACRSANRSGHADVSYGYSNGSLIKNPQTYFYTPYAGPPFLDAWKTSRAQALSELGRPAMAPPYMEGKPCASPGGTIDTAGLLEALFHAYESGLGGQVDDDRLRSLVQRFEVTKRIHRQYSDRWRPVDPTDYGELSLYVRFAELLEVAYARHGNLVFLNALLKCLDTLIAVRLDLSKDLAARLARLVSCEGAHIDLLRARVAL